MQFLYPALTWGFLLVLVPLAIHLINLMRQRRVEWGAMEFLLEAYRKHRKWIWMKQFLLLALRMLAVILAVGMLAHLVTNRQWTRFLGGRTTHHVVLLDDSFSMSDRETRSAFDGALAAVTDLARTASRQSTPQRFTLLRYSRASARDASTDQVEAGTPNAGDGVRQPPAVNADKQSPQPAARPRQPGAEGEKPADPLEVADLSGATVDTRLLDLLAQRTAGWKPTEMAVGPESALKIASQLVAASERESFVIYVLSDFRRDPWQQASEIRSILTQLEARGAAIQLVRCVDEAHANLAITDLSPGDGIRAAGVPLFVDVTVKNYGPQVARNVSITLQGQDGPVAASGESSDQKLPDPLELPGLTVDSIAAGESVTRRFQVFFPVAGEHVVRAALPPDPVPTDNQRRCTMSFPESVPVLVIDGDPQQSHAKYLSTVFQPASRVQTGIRPTMKDAAYLRDASRNDLRGFAAIYLLDVARLDETAEENLRAYVAGGGGVAIFLGPNANLAAYSQWQARAPDLFPMILERQETLGPSLENLPDITVADHPLFRVLQGDGNPLLSRIRFSQFIRGEVAASNDRRPGPRVLASLRSGHPLVVENSRGAGRVIVVLSTLAPLWNNWATQPTFVVFILELQAYLGSQDIAPEDHLIGEPVSFQLPASEYLPDVEIRTMGERRDRSAPQAPSAAPTEGSALSVATVRALPIQQDGADAWNLDLAEVAGGGGQSLVDRQGALWLRLQKVDGEFDDRVLAFNPDPAESDMILARREQLARQFADMDVQVVRAESLRADDPRKAGFEWSELLLYALVSLLLLEQILAYANSYHTRIVRTKV